MMKTTALLICYYFISLRAEIVKHRGRIEEVKDPTRRSNVQENPARRLNGIKNETPFKRDDISQLISSSISQQEGKPYGDNENYEPIGDGVYLLTDGAGTSYGHNDRTSKLDVKEITGSVKGNFPNTQSSITDILSNLDEEDKSIIDGGKTEDTQIPVTVNNNNGAHSVEQRVTENNFVVPIYAKKNVEDVSPTEVNMIKDIECSLRRDDGRANQYENNYNYKYSGIDPHLNSSSQPVFKTTVVETYPFAEENKNFTVSKRTSDTDALIAQIIEADKRLKEYTGGGDFNVEHYVYNRANEISLFVGQGEPKLMNDSVSSRKVKKGNNIEKQLKGSEKILQQVKQIVSEGRLQNVSLDNTNFFMNEERDRSDRNVTLSGRKDVKAHNKMRNISEKVKTDTQMTKRKTGTKVSNSAYVTISRRNRYHHSKRKAYKHKNAKKAIQQYQNKPKQLVRNQDLRLINILNISNILSAGDHAEAVWTVRRIQNTTGYTTKHASVAGKYGFHSKAEKLKLKKNVGKKKHTPIEEYARRGTKKFVTNEDDNNLQIDHYTVQKVNAALSEEDNKMFAAATPNNINPAASDVNLQQERLVGQDEGQLLGIPSNMNDGGYNINSQPVPQAVRQEKQLLGISGPMKSVARDIYVQPGHELEQNKQIFGFPGSMKVADSDDNLQVAHEIGQNKKMLGSTMKVDDSTINLQTERVIGKSGNNVKEYNDVSVQDGINSEELKDAINDSDLKGLKQIRTELDTQDLRTAMAYFGKGDKKESANERAVEHLVQQPMEVTSTISKVNNNGIKNVYDDVNEEQRSKYMNMQNNVNTLSRLVKLMSKRNDSESESIDVENATQVNGFNTNNDVENNGRDKQYNIGGTREKPSLEDIAKKIEELMNRRKQSGDQTLSNGDREYRESKETNPLELNNMLSIFQKSNNLQDSSTTNEKLDFSSKQVYKPVVPPSRDHLEKLAAEKERNSMSSEMIDNLFNGKHTENILRLLAVQKLLNVSEGEGGAKEETFSAGVKGELQINGGKVLGGNVRGGRILGGIILGGNITGGEIDGGRITGGTIKDGLFINGLMENGVLEGGKIRGGDIRGGVIKGGVVDNGIITGGVMSGGELINGSIEGGVFKGGEIYGGTLKSGEMDGGTLKAGTIDGGTMKGGIIDGGRLEGGVMLAGEIRGGIVKSGIIRGGIIDKGVVITDAEIGPGVEIHEGMVIGGKITANGITRSFRHARKTSSVDNELEKRIYHSDENRSNIMYSIKITKDGNDNDEGNENATPISKNEISRNGEVLNKATTLSRILMKNTTADKVQEKTKEVAWINKNYTHHSNENITLHMLYGNITDTLLKKSSRSNNRNDNNSSNNNDADITIGNYADHNRNMKLLIPMADSRDTRKYLQNPKKGESLSSKLVANWELSNGTFNTIKGNPGADLRMFNGVDIRNGHAVLDGLHGYLDAGDFQGECFSDPEVCSNGFTVQMTLKVYSKSVFSRNRLFIMDSGATLSNSRGISLWVTGGRIYGLVVTREKTWCINTFLYPYIEKWISLTLIWRRDIGMQLFINCRLFDQSSDHKNTECGICENCHQTDDCTRLMFGRPNKGPHFEVIHMAVGMISLYEKFLDIYEIEDICGKEGARSKPVEHTPTHGEAPPKKKISRVPVVTVIEPILRKLTTYPVDTNSGIVWPTPRTKVTRRYVQEHKTTAIKWPRPAPMVKHIQILPTRNPKERMVNLTEKDSSRHQLLLRLPQL